MELEMLFRLLSLLLGQILGSHLVMGVGTSSSALPEKGSCGKQVCTLYNFQDLY